MKTSAIIKAVLLTVFIGFFTAPQFARANSGGVDNGNGNGGHDNGGGNGHNNGGGGTSVPMDGLSVLLIAGAAYTTIKVYKVYNSGKTKENLI
jgi:hypothetical protein